MVCGAGTGEFCRRGRTIGRHSRGPGGRVHDLFRVFCADRCLRVGALTSVAAADSARDGERVRPSALVWLLASVCPLAASAQTPASSSAHSLSKAAPRRRQRSGHRPGCWCRWCRPARSLARRSEGWARSSVGSTPAAGYRCLVSPTSTRRHTPLLPQRLPAHRLAPTTTASSDRRPRVHQERLRRLSWFRAAAQDQRRPEIRWRAGISTGSRANWFVGAQGTCRELSGASANPRRTTSFSRHWASRGSSRPHSGWWCCTTRATTKTCRRRGWYPESE